MDVPCLLLCGTLRRSSWRKHYDSFAAWVCVPIAVWPSLHAPFYLPRARSAPAVGCARATDVERPAYHAEARPRVLGRGIVYTPTEELKQRLSPST